MPVAAFTDDQYDSAYPEGIEYHWWNLARNRILSDALKTISGEKSKIVEVGCGRGVVVRYLRANGFDCVGIELAPVEPFVSVQNYVQTGMGAEDLPEEERRSYKILLLLDVIEHVADPVSFVADLLRTFPDLRHVLFTVPARQELWSNYDDFYGHHRRYNLGMLKQFSAYLPVELVREGYFFHSVYLPLWFLNFFKRKRGTVLRPPSRSTRWLHKCFSFCMTLDFYLLPKRLPGTSLLACFSIVTGRMATGENLLKHDPCEEDFGL